MTEINLDQPTTYPLLDPGDMYRRVNDLPEQIETAWRLGTEVRLPEEYRQARNVVIVGMGGSAIGGSLLASYGEGQVPIPVVVWRGYGLPAFVDSSSLVIAASYSGGTEETLSGFTEARRRGARLLAVTTGGVIGELAEKWGTPTVRFAYDAQPRATLGYLFTPMIAIFARLGFLPPQAESVHEAIDIAGQSRARWCGDEPAASNEAKQLAVACQGKGVVIYGASYLAEVAHRWKTQFNENAKSWAFWEEFPELNHNAVVGYDHPAALHGALLVVLLNGSDLPHEIVERVRITRQILAEHGVSHHTVEAQGESRLAQMVSLISLGDYVSYYLALLNDVDPTTIEPIDFLKRELTGSR